MADEPKAVIPAVAPAIPAVSIPSSPAASPAPVAVEPAKPAEGAPAATPPADKPDESTLLGGKPKDAKSVEGAPQAAPEKYTDFTLPDGSVLDKGIQEKISPLFKEMGISQENGQKLVAFQAEQAKAQYDAAVSERNQELAKWREENKTFLGAESEKLISVAAKALDRFGSPELRSFLNQTGLGDNPHLVKFVVAIGKAIIEDQPPTGEKSGSGTDNILATRYPSMNK